MSLNNITLSPSRTPIPLQNEINLKTVDDVEYTLHLHLPDSNKIEGRGNIFLTDLRLIIVANPPTDAFESLSVPHTALHSSKYEDARLFNSPRVLFGFKPTPGGGLGEDGLVRAELRCSKNGKDPFSHFAAALDKTRERAVNKSRANPEDEFDLPAYGDGPSGCSSSTTTMTYVGADNDLPSDAPPGYEP